MSAVGEHTENFLGFIHTHIPFALVVYLGQTAFQKQLYYKVYPFIRSLSAAGKKFQRNIKLDFFVMRSTPPFNIEITGGHRQHIKQYQVSKMSGQNNYLVV